jgi:hypothetical protein
VAALGGDPHAQAGLQAPPASDGFGSFGKPQKPLPSGPNSGDSSEESPIRRVGAATDR